MFYAGTTFDIFVSTKAIAIKSIVSKIIPATELGKMFSVLGIIDSIDALIFPSIYSFVYLNTVETFTGAIYLLSEFFFILTLIMFIVIYILLRDVGTKTKPDPETNESFKSDPNLYEVTKL
jgi:MFS transporter, PCFT/HCP family, solute carrier family 46, member 3